ncbi:hypothetical protein J6590_066307 [Homalodisca vitripennis]|nr:hypothetical protein J6590_066307 [Homalodisca vitripennis]
MRKTLPLYLTGCLLDLFRGLRVSNIEKMQQENNLHRFAENTNASCWILSDGRSLQIPGVKFVTVSGLRAALGGNLLQPLSGPKAKSSKSDQLNIFLSDAREEFTKCQKKAGWRQSSHLELMTGEVLFQSLRHAYLLHVGTHITAPRPTRESADCWPSHGETIAAQYLTCKFRHVRTDTRPSWPHRGRTVTDSSGLNFDGHGAV